MSRSIIFCSLNEIFRWLVTSCNLLWFIFNVKVIIKVQSISNKYCIEASELELILASCPYQIVSLFILYLMSAICWTETNLHLLLLPMKPDASLLNSYRSWLSFLISNNFMPYWTQDFLQWPNWCSSRES